MRQPSRLFARGLLGASLLVPVLALATPAQASTPLIDTTIPAQAATAECYGHAAMIVGSSGPDELIGGGDQSVIDARAGNDTVHGQSGPDIICGKDGADWLYGENSPDWLFGGFGDDVLIGGAHKDILDGGPGYDICFDQGERTGVYNSCERFYFRGEYPLCLDEPVMTFGSRGADQLFGVNDQRDVILARDGNDNISLQEFGPMSLPDHSDVACGNGGNDSISGLGRLSGGKGNDQLSSDPAGTGRYVTRLYGGHGDDWLIPVDGDIARGGPGNDSMRGQYPGDNGREHGTIFSGNSGDDFIDSQDRAGTDIVVGGSGNDRCLVDAADTVRGCETIQYVPDPV